VWAIRTGQYSTVAVNSAKDFEQGSEHIDFYLALSKKSLRF